MSKRFKTRSAGLALFGLVAALLTVAHPVSKAIVNGSGDAHADVAESVVQIFNGGGKCTGTLIHPSWVLTAAHCLDGVTSAQQIPMRIGNQTLDVGGEVRRGTHFIRHPSHNGTNGVDAHDVALVKLNIPSYQPVARLARPDESSQWDSDGRYLAIAGWGTTTDVCVPANPMWAPTLQFGMIRVSGTQNGTIRYTTGDGSTYQNSGDSGGPMFFFEDGRIVVAGVSSSVRQNDTDNACDEGFYVEVGQGPDRNWIRSQIPDIDAPSSPWDDNDSYLYGVDPTTGDLMCYRHNGYLSGAGYNPDQPNHTPKSWSFSRTAGWGWGSVRNVFSTTEAIYAVMADGSLRSFRHSGHAGCLNPNEGGWVAGRNIAGDFSGYTKMFGMSTNDYPNGGGVFYGITASGSLRWFRDTCAESGGGCVTGGHEVGVGWGNLRDVFSAGNGVINVVTNSGQLKRYRHNGYKTGQGLGTPGSWSGGGQTIASGWTYQRTFAGVDDILYGVSSNGDLTRIEVSGLSWYYWPRVKVGEGWADLWHVFMGSYSIL